MTETHTPAEPERVFGEPWHAHAFALALQFARAGYFTWEEWTTKFSARLKAAPAAHRTAETGRPITEVDSTTYYDVWLETLESLLIKLRLASAEDLIRLRDAWIAAYLNTPHGNPVVLLPDGNNTRDLDNRGHVELRGHSSSSGTL